LENSDVFLAEDLWIRKRISELNYVATTLAIKSVKIL
jgi:hypothetical protein